MTHTPPPPDAQRDPRALPDPADPTGDRDRPAQRRAATPGVPIYTIALGTAGGQVTVDDQFGRPVTLDVPPDTETLAQIAEVTGATAFDAPTAQDLSAVYDNFQSRIGTTQEKQEITAWFVAAALVLVVAGAGLSAIWFGRLPWMTRRILRSTRTMRRHSRGVAMAKSKAERRKHDVELAEVRSDPPVEEIGSTVRTLSNKAYLREIATLQVELVKQLEWIKPQGLRVVVIFEGGDAAEKGGAIKTISLSLNPRFCRVVALGTPTEREMTQWCSSARGSSWSSAGSRSATRNRNGDSRVAWRTRPIAGSSARWTSSRARSAPSHVVNADNKKRARLNVIHHLRSLIPYEDLTPDPIVLPARQGDSGDVRPPMADQTFVSGVY